MGTGEGGKGGKVEEKEKMEEGRREKAGRGKNEVKGRGRRGNREKR